MTSAMDPFDELAALFLTEPDAPSASASTVAARAATELVVVGHLPVRAGLWLTPYVDSIARHAGPAALVRLDQDSPTIELLRASEAALPIQPPAPADVRAAIDCVAGHICVWMIRAPESATPIDLIRAGADRITLLSSADEAAVVAAYRIVKDLVEAAENSGAALPAIGLAVIGSSEQQASRMLDRLNRTTATFLGVRLPLVACLNRMDAAVRTTRFWRLPVESRTNLGQTVGWIHGNGHRASLPSNGESGATDHEHAAGEVETEPMWPRPPRRHAIPMPPIPSVRETERAKAEQRDPPMIDVELGRRVAHEPPATQRPVAPTQREPSFHASTPRPSPTSPSVAQPPITHAPIRPAPFGHAPTSDVDRELSPGEAFARHAAAAKHEPSIRTIKMPPKPARQVETKLDAARVHEPDEHGAPVPLSRYIDGLSSLDRIRCPRHERVEIAIDAAGRMHLLSREPSMRELWIVEAWAKAHRELIAMACPSVSFDFSRPPTMHVFTDRPASLADLYDSDLQLHVLAPVKVGNQVGWYCAPLKES